MNTAYLFEKIPIFKALSDLGLGNDEIVSFLYDQDIIHYKYDKLSYLMNLDFIPESRDFFHVESLKDILKLLKIRSKKNPPIQINYDYAVEMLRELSSIKFKVLNDKNRKNDQPHDIIIEGTPYCIASYDSIHETKYSVDLYELGFINEYSVVSFIDYIKSKQARKGNLEKFKEDILHTIGFLISKKIERTFKKEKSLQKDQTVMFKNKEKEYSKSRLMYLVESKSKELYSDDVSEMFDNLAEYLEDSSSASNYILSTFVDSLSQSYDEYIDEDIDPEDVFCQKYNVRAVYRYSDGAIFI